MKLTPRPIDSSPSSRFRTDGYSLSKCFLDWEVGSPTPNFVSHALSRACKLYLCGPRIKPTSGHKIVIRSEEPLSDHINWQTYQWAEPPDIGRATLFEGAVEWGGNESARGPQKPRPPLSGDTSADPAEGSAACGTPGLTFFESPKAMEVHTGGGEGG
jgi:hypothetical protein